MVSKSLKIAVFGHYGNKNLGDEAIIQAVIENVRKKEPASEVVCFSIRPEDSAERYGVTAYPIRRGSQNTSSSRSAENTESSSKERENRTSSSTLKLTLKKIPLLVFCKKLASKSVKTIKAILAESRFLYTSFKRLKGVDLLMVTGSNQFLDNFGGPWGFPYTLLKWSILTKLRGGKVAFVSVGAGPISYRTSRILIRLTLCFADFVSLRDKPSEKMIRELIGYKGETHVYPDLAHSLLVEGVKEDSDHTLHGDPDKPVIGINPMPIYDTRYWCEQDEGKYEALVLKMVDFISRLITEGYRFFLFPTQEKDNNVIEDILFHLQQKNLLQGKKDDYTLTSSTVDELMGVIAVADISLATRFHGGVLSLLSKKPMLGVCYHGKSKDLFAQMGQADYAVDLDTFSAEDLWDRFLILTGKTDEEKEKIALKVDEYKASLDEQYDKLLKLR